MMPFYPTRSTAATPMSSRIPAALARVGRPNKACRELYSNSAAWDTYCAGMPEYDSTKSPYANMPPGGREIQEIAALPLSSVPFDGSNNAVLSFTAPIGYDGIANRLINFFTGTGFAEGSGGIVWRVKVGNKYARNLGSILFTYGSLNDPYIIPGTGIPIVSGQTVTYYVSVPASSSIGGASPQFVCAVMGWFWPRL